MKGLRDRYEAFHKLQIQDDALVAAGKLAERYISDRYLPDKAIDLMDEASSKVRLRNSGLPPEAKELERELRDISKRKEEAIRSQDFELAGELRDKEQVVRDQIREVTLEWKEEKGRDYKPVVTENDIADVVANWTKIPITKLTESETERLIKMEDILHERIIGQHDAVVSVSRAIRRGCPAIARK